MEKKKNVLNKLKGNRIWIPVLVGLSISFWLLIRSLNETRFVEVKANEIGTHEWVDFNNNGEIDFWLEDEFFLSDNGAYRTETITDILQQIDWSYHSIIWLLIAFLMMAIRDFGYMARIRMLTDKQLTWKQSFYVIMIWEFASALTPGVVGGTAVAMFILNKEKISMGRSTAIVVITALMDNLFFVIIVPILLLFIHFDTLLPDTSIHLKHSVYYFFWIGYSAMLLVCILLFLSLFLFPNLIKHILTGICKIPLFKRFKAKAIQTGEEISTTALQFGKRSFSFWLRIFFTTLISWTGRYLVINMILMAFLPLGILDHLIVFAKQFILWVMMLVSPTPGASGVAEWAFTSLLSDLTSSGLVIVALSVIWRLISYFPYLFIGAFLLPKWLKK